MSLFNPFQNSISTSFNSGDSESADSSAEVNTAGEKTVKDSTSSSKIMTTNSNNSDSTRQLPPQLVSKPGRCSKCSKKTGLIPFDCKCGYKFCGRCRYPYAHDCTYDHTSDNRAAIIKANPLVAPEKINRI